MEGCCSFQLLVGECIWNKEKRITTTTIFNMLGGRLVAFVMRLSIIASKSRGIDKVYLGEIRKE
jgi:hypothetical protein